MMTTSSFMSTLTAFAFVVGSLLRIALKVSIFSSLIHSHKLKVRSGLLEAAALFKLVLMFLCRRLISPGRELCTSLSWTGGGDGFQGKVVMESILETQAATILEFFAGLRGTPGWL